MIVAVIGMAGIVWLGNPYALIVAVLALALVPSWLDTRSERKTLNER
ncbi:hypothetical protein ACGFJC_52960 [Nonomuraea fuscirosea]